MIDSASRPVSRRIELLDVLRGIALLAMASYHFTWDLEFFGYLPPAYATEGGWRLYARGIATTFLVLVGIGLVLADNPATRRRSRLRRLALIVAGAAAITAATAALTPQSFVFFGILHLIAFASISGLPLLLLPAWANALLAVAIMIAGNTLTTHLTDPRWLAWIGFSASPPISNDFVPVFPWFGVVVAGIALGQALAASGLTARLAAWNPRLRKAAPLAWLGRHSLAFYLIHQPISIAVVAAVSFVAPPDQTRYFTQSCERGCLPDRDAAFCTRYCACVRDDLTKQDLLADTLMGRLDAAREAKVRESVAVCSLDP
ncbi:heparan-alpha-glucosaminide N-acetyltransferase [Aureimonas sp. AU4]|uniref:heparan-alpha-glucosaminide N-acetyltransferase n=1 Tax=Aureimonas sp. AU4 TaxID=1638163 RepID=UPI0007812E24|nr:heparan-alpha-glucosaminide N-acetyltransferase [Aureimonas sp. AU4]